MATTPRGKILEDAIKATEGDRNRSYGEPAKQLGLAGAIKLMCRENAGRLICNAEMEALDLVITKLSRAFVGSAPGRDTYVDGAAFFAIAGECAHKGLYVQDGKVYLSKEHALKKDVTKQVQELKLKADQQWHHWNMDDYPEHFEYTK